MTRVWTSPAASATIFGCRSKGTQLANTRSAKKRIKQNEKRRERNRPVRTRARTQVRLARTAIEGGKPDLATAAVQEAIQQLDRAADAGVIHRKNAARRKSRLMKRLASVQQGRG